MLDFYVRRCLTLVVALNDAMKVKEPYLLDQEVEHWMISVDVQSVIDILFDPAYSHHRKVY